ncbi:MAG: hypothetical protein GXO77_15405 [Calditrichaeota bacterium]|nr:hypothetical protein [Calditrichota bacterium]
MDLLNPGNIKRFGLYLLCAILVVSLINCTPQVRYRILSVFFDGVPNPEQTKKKSNQLSLDSLQTNKANRLTLQKKNEPEAVLHPPFADRDCAVCHNMGIGSSLSERQPELCFECHDDFRSEYTQLHGPVALGKCTTCHHPHLSKNKYLLKRAGQQLCLYCHQKSDVLKNEVHEDLGDTACTECHNAHGGDEASFLN